MEELSRIMKQVRMESMKYLNQQNVHISNNMIKKTCYKCSVCKDIG